MHIQQPTSGRRPALLNILILLTVFFTGLAAAALKPMAFPAKAKTCPVVAGEEVVSTMDNGTSQSCLYARSYGRAITRRNI